MLQHHDPLAINLYTAKAVRIVAICIHQSICHYIVNKYIGSIINVGVRENSLASTFIFLQKKKHKSILFG